MFGWIWVGDFHIHKEEILGLFDYFQYSCRHSSSMQHKHSGVQRKLLLSRKCKRPTTGLCVYTCVYIQVDIRGETSMCCSSGDFHLLLSIKIVP